MARLIMVFEDGIPYRVIDDNKPMAKCYKCARYPICDKKSDAPCMEIKGLGYLKIIPVMDKESKWFNVKDITFTKTRVKYKGRLSDKCEVKSLIHETEYMLGNIVWPLVTDIYWYDMRYSELKEHLERNVSLLNGLMAMSRP